MPATEEAFSARSWLFAPGDSDRKMQKAADSPADIVLLDLEDAVTEDAKPKARTMISAFLESQPSAARRRLWVRINPLDGPHALADLAAVIPARPGGIMLPKSRGRATSSFSTTTCRRSKSRPVPTRAQPRSSPWRPRRPRACSPSAPTAARPGWPR